MCINNLPTEILSYIITFLNNKTSTRLIRSCNSIHKYGQKFGYLTHLKATSNTDMLEFFGIFLEHSDCVTTVEINGVENPQLLLPRFVRNLSFNHCSISNDIDPGKKVYETKKIRLRDYHRYKNKQILRINWSCFPNLEELDLYVYDVDLTGIKELEKLKIIKINTVKKE